MPLYEFKCKAGCDTFEELVSLGTQEIDCPECGEKAEQVISSGNIKVWWYDADRMDARADMRKVGVHDA